MRERKQENMNRLRGTGTTFSTSGKRWHPFESNPKVARRNARLHRLKAKGLLPAGDKASLRAMADEAVRTQNAPAPKDCTD